MIIPYGAGGTTDTWGRKLAVLLEKYLGQPITVTNQGGASGSIGSQFVKEQPSDGYTLLVCAETMGTYRTMNICDCLLYTSPSPRDGLLSRMPSSA